jgi:simple sugar transport system ATP-binding protein
MKLELQGITKRFGALVANDAIDLVVESGEIHSLLGENGAGKSTLMNVLFGLYSADAGQILLNDKIVNFSGPGDAMAAGIGMVHQHFMLIPVFTVAENVALGHEPTKGLGVLDLEAARKLVSEISDRFGFSVDPDALVEDLPVGVQQRVEIIKSLARDAKILVLDEPTAVLTPQETDELMEIMRDLAKSGTSIVFITHKLREVKAVADKITVIRQGRVIGQAKPTDSTAELASLMVGREVDLTVEKIPASPGNLILKVNQASVLDDRDQLAVKSVSFEVRAGEILAIAGVQGNGQTELAEAIVGLQEHVTGNISLEGRDITRSSVRGALHAGIAFVPESREEDGLISSFSIEENLILDLHDLPPYAKGLVISPTVVSLEAQKRVKEFDIRAQSAKDKVSSLSGGNKQKVVLARELSRPVKLVVASQPTRGIDVGSIEFVHKKIIAERDAGRAVLLFSTELDEVSALADRIAVMYRGEFIAIVPADTSREDLGLLMAGVRG